jgi:hypothetical protein
MALMHRLADPTNAEREALLARAQGLLPLDDDLRAIVLCFTPQQAANAAKVAA